MSAIEVDPIKPVTGVCVEAAVIHSEWQSSICGCFSNCGVLCQTLCCFHCTLSNVYTKLESNVAACSCGSCCGICCTDLCTGCQQSFWGVVGTRREVIARYNIAGESMCKTCCCTTLCCACSFCQTQRELILRNEGAGGCCAQGSVPQNARAPDAPMPMHTDNGQPVQPHQAQQPTTPYGAPVFYGAARPVTFWGSGLCGCGCMECCEIMFCTPCTLGFIASKIDNLHNIGEPNAEPSMSCCVCFHSLCSAGACAFAYMNRRELIQRYNVVDESHMDTCCRVYLCAPCAVSQQRREMGYQGHFPGGCCVKDAPVRAQ
jgi:Cys-rich protein (TIGR01571 family)